MLSPRQAGFIAVSLSLSSPVVLAKTGWDVCPVPSTPDTPSEPPTTLRPAGLDAMAVYVEADQALFRDQGASELSGDVIIARDDKWLQADQATYDKQTQQVTATGKVRFRTGTLQLNSDQLAFNLENNLGTLDNVAYLLNGSDGRGSSKRLIQDGNRLTRLEDASYTTCPPGQNSWSIKAADLQLDHVKEKGTARNVTFQINDKPLIYLPYFSFPLTDERTSGFLIPSAGTDEKSGLRLSIPYYLNLAPNYDLTLTTNLFSKRGLQEKSEFRYLFNKHAGNVNYDILPNDLNYDNKLRYFYNINHNSQLGPHSKLTLQASGVSDNDYFNDLGSTLATSSIVYLERTLNYSTANPEQHWTFNALAQGYQVLDSSVQTYSRLPQLQLDWRPPTLAGDVQVNAAAEYTYFSGNNADDGHRLDFQAGIRKTFSNEYAYVTPALKLHHTHYALNRDTDKTLARSLPTASLDAGLFLERPLDGGKKIQTLEPRIYYTFTPFRTQSNIPVFDSSERTLSYSQLFSDNRFTGKDRVADTNRLSTSLTTRLQQVEQGQEILRASIGQMYYFDERKVTLPEESTQTGTRSEVVMEVSGELTDTTRMSGTAFVDTDKRSFSANQMTLNYHDQQDRILNIGYSQRKGEYKAAGISFATPLTQQWRLVGSYEQDMKNKRMLETLAGAEYQSCCWKGRLAARKYLLSDNKTYDDAIFVEVELKGLGSFGSATRNLLENRIYGYE